MDILEILNQPTVYYILTGVLEVLVFVLIARRGMEKGFVFEISGLVSLAAAVFVLSLVLRIYTGMKGGAYLDAAAGVGTLLAALVVYSLVRLAMGALHLAARLPVIRVLDSVLGLFAGLVIGTLFLIAMEKISPFFIEKPLRLVTGTVPQVYALLRSTFS